MTRKWLKLIATLAILGNLAVASVILFSMLRHYGFSVGSSVALIAVPMVLTAISTAILQITGDD